MTEDGLNMNPKYEIGDEIKCNINTWMNISFDETFKLDECL